MGYAVVGGGIAGASTAYHLACAGADVTVYERGRVGEATTARSAAFFGFYGTEAGRAMKRYGLRRYNEFFADPRADLFHDLVGRLRVSTGAPLDAGPGAERIPPDELREHVLLPELDTDGVEAVTWRPNVGYLRPRPLAREFAARAREAGATVHERTPAEPVVDGGEAVGIETEGDRVETDAVVLAAGPWNAELAAGAGLDLPLSHTLAPVLRLRADLPHTLPIVSHADSGVYVRGGENDTVLVGHHPGHDAAREIDPDGVGDEVPADLRTEMERVVADLFPVLGDAPAVEEWVGVRSMTPDGNPIVGPTAVDGLAVAAFHSSGIQLAPAAGALLADHLLDRSLPGYADAVAPGRF
jgi:sarcosine oxidase subunit beta